MPTCLIALGANLGERGAAIDGALARLEREPQVRVLRRSQWRETTPVGGPEGQTAFLNGAALLETSLSAEALLALLLRVENELGRRRAERWGPRAIDLDLLLYDEHTCNTSTLVVPHPRMAWRRFVLEPAAEVAGAMVHPTTGWTVQRLLTHLNTAPHYVAMAGGIGAGKTLLAERLAAACGGRVVREQPNGRLLRRFYADPSGNAWQTELEFVRHRTRLLDARDTDWADRRRLTVSDFWFDQSKAFAQVWLPIQQRRAFFALCDRARRRVARPKLIVLLDLPSRRLHEQTVRRARPYERRLNRAILRQTAQAIVNQTNQKDVGPVLRLTGGTADTMLAEVIAAVQSMGESS